MSFDSLGLSPELLKTVKQVGFTTPTPIQTKAIPEALAGHDLIGIAQTGTGKTAAFALPLLQTLSSGPGRMDRRPRALILAPTRELAAQIEEAVRALSAGSKLRIAVIFGGVGEQPQIQALRRGVDVLIATPGRLLDLAGQRHADLSAVRYAVLDEADRMLDMGFLPQIRKVISLIPKERQTLLFSATLSKDIEKVAGEVLRNPRTVEVGRRANPAESVTQLLISVDKSRKVDLLAELLRDANLDSVLVFSRTKHGADKIARKLAQTGISVATLHSNRSQSQRTKALASFKDGRVRVLVATDIAARGIDVEEISHVINFDFPPQAEDYVHRIGRTGRAAATGDAISFVTPDDEGAVRALERMIGKKVPRETRPGYQVASRETAAPAVRRPATARPGQPHSSQTATAHRPNAPVNRFARPAQAKSRTQSGTRRRSY
jgi:ATP-dependent RNA helicase RhlE